MGKRTTIGRLAEIAFEISERIRASRYRASRQVNQELLLLYFQTGQLLKARIAAAQWGDAALSTISAEIQRRIPGIRGFSTSNLKNMRQFYVAYAQGPFSQLLTGQMAKSNKSQLPTGQTSRDRTSQACDAFVHVGFTHHMLLLQRCESVDERVFYMQEAARNQWSVDVLRYHIASDLFSKRHGRANNFGTALPAPLRKHAAEAFKDEYLLDFISMDDSSGEAALEGALVKNLREFLMSLGREFAFMGNQYRIVVDEEEFFVDLLFYHRQLRSLVAVDLKVGRFRPEYAGKMNFYLEALDRHVKLPHENPSIGIILCREKRNTIVEYAFKRIDRPMGVATYALDGNLPPQFRGYLPSPDQLKMVADKGLAPGTIDHTCAASLNRPRRKKRNRTSARSQS